MISPETFYNFLFGKGINFYCGVPDSLLKEFCAYTTSKAGPKNHIISANEGSAIAIAAGHYIGTGRPAMVYMQNSGLGNAINPLLSLADKEVYGIPMFLLIGWRGEPGVFDEPQHVKQGRVTTSLLDAMEIPWFVLDDAQTWESILEDAFSVLNKATGPVALLVRKGFFSSADIEPAYPNTYPLTREVAIKAIVDCLGSNDLVVSTTGMASRELYEYRLAIGDGHANDFLTVGSMGHAISIAHGLALVRPNERVICLDGDGAVLMHMGALAVLAHEGPQNLIHVVLNNGAHDSVGGQPTVGFSSDFVGIAQACGYRKAVCITDACKITQFFQHFVLEKGPIFLEIRIARGGRPDIGRPTSTPSENRDELMRRLFECR